MTARGLLLKSLATVLALVVGFTSLSAQAACPAGMTATADGYCVRADQKYCGNGQVCSDNMACADGGQCFYANGCWPDQTEVRGLGCMPRGATFCPAVGFCPAGQSCTARGCSGPAGTGPVCRDGMRAPAGNVCNPYDGHSYNPREAKLCGTALCDVRFECGNNTCLSPFKQEAATRATPSGPSVQTPTVSAPAPGTGGPTVSTTTPNVPKPPSAGTSTPNVGTPNVQPGTPTVQGPTVRNDAKCSQAKDRLAQFRASMGDAWYNDQLKQMGCN